MKPCIPQTQYIVFLNIRYSSCFCKHQTIALQSPVTDTAKMTKKIRIGYVLKSADVGTLFSSRYSENSSHAHTRRHPHTFTHTCAHQCTVVHTYAHPPIPRTPAHTHTHSCIPAHTRAHTHIPTRKEEEEEERKRKEQESAESISGLQKSCYHP